MPSIRPETASVKARYAVLLDIGRIITGTLRPADLYATVHAQTARVLRMERFFISLYEPADDTATVAFCAGARWAGRVSATYPGRENVAIRTRRPALLPAGTPVASAGAVGLDAPDCAALVAPMLHESRVLGTITAIAHPGEGYSKSELELLAAVADLTAVALDNSRYVLALEQSRREAERMEEIALALAESLELPRVLNRITAAALDLMRADSSTVWLRRDDDTVEVAAAAGERALQVGVQLPLPHPLYEHMLRYREALVFEDKETAALLPENVRSLTPASSTMAAPLIVEGDVIGALSIGHHDRRRYHDDHVRLLGRLAHQASLALGNARLHEKIQALSLTDALTGLPNRRQLDLFLEREVAAARRGRPLTVLLCDLDRFKEYNDAAGHHAGDLALQAFAHILLDSTRAMNLVARFGGDEFVAVLADCDRAGGGAHAARLHAAVREHPLLRAAGVGAAIGIATFDPAIMADASALLRAADRDMYERKSGRLPPLCP